MIVSVALIPMVLGTYRFSDLGTVIECLHALFDQWEETLQAGSDHEVDLDMLHRTKLAVHEWLANLVQHADFTTRDPLIVVAFRKNEHLLECVIEDNSEGFDLHAQLSVREERLNPYPERGIGLLMLRACTENLTYDRLNAHHNRLAFSISADQDPLLHIPF